MSLLDKLPKIPFLNSNNQKGQYYFALNITEKKVEAALWGIEGKKLLIINTVSSRYSGEQSLAEAGNYCLDEVLADFPIEPTKILYGVPESWLQDDNLKPEHLKLLRKLSKDLDITPMAFVSYAHAISHLLQKQQGVPLTAILVEVGDNLNVSVVKAGKILGNKLYKRSENLPQDIEKALLSFPEIEVLPSKILLYGEENLEHFKDELQAFSWMSQLPFLHLPKIEQLPKEISMQAICLAGSSELNPDVVFHPQPPVPMPSDQHTGQQLDEGVDNLGFVEGDIEEMVSEPAKLPVRRGVHPQEKTEQTSQQNTSILDKVHTAIMLPFHHKTPTGFWKIRMVIIPAVILVALILGSIFLPKAKITIFIDMQQLEKNTTVTADPSVSSVDEANKIIPGKIVQTTENGSAKGSATGTKQVGEGAKGGVVIYNKTDSPKTFNAGTSLTGPNNLKYALDTSVQIASQSAVDSGISFGKATVAATAAQIGPDGNIPAGSQLTIDGISSSQFSAKVDQAFTGGVSKNVTVVSADDQKKLLAQLASDLRKKAQSNLQGQMSGDAKILEEALFETIIKQSYSKNVGDQASDFTLNLTIKYKGTSYNDADLKKIVSKLIETNIPTGFDLDLSKTETQAVVSKLEKDGKLVFSAKFIAKLVPKLDQEKVKSEIAGKTPQQVAEILKQINNVIGSDIQLKPQIPFKPLQRLPFLAKNITLEVTAK